MCDYHVMPFDLQDNERPTVIFNVTHRDTVCQCSSWSGEEEYTSSYFCVVKQDDGQVVYCDDYRHKNHYNSNNHYNKESYKDVAENCISDHLASFRGNQREEIGEDEDDEVFKYDLKFYEISY